MSADEIYKLPDSGDVALTHDTAVDGADLQRFIDAGGTIYKRGFQLFIAYPKRKDVPSTGDAAWGKAGEHYRELARTRADEGTGVQLACLVLADYCAHRWIGDCGGPTLEMIMLAENTVGSSLDEVVASELARVDANGAGP